MILIMWLSKRFRKRSVAQNQKMARSTIKKSWKKLPLGRKNYSEHLISGSEVRLEIEFKPKRLDLEQKKRMLT